MAAVRRQPHHLHHARLRQTVHPLWGLVYAFALLAWAPSVRAQNLPDAGSIQRDIERQQQVRPPLAPPPVPRAEPTPAQPADLQFQLNAFVLEGVSLVDPDALQTVLQPWLGRPIQFSDLEQAKQAIVGVYQRHGWFVRPQIPEQELQDNGELRIELIEGRLGEVRIDGTSAADVDAARLNKDRIVKTFTARQRPGAYLYTPHIERAISLINDTPGMAVGATLASGQQAGATDVVLSPTVRELFSGNAGLDNTGSRSTGVSKVNAGLSLNSPMGWGDQTTLNLMRSKGVDYRRLGYSLPWGHDGLRLGINASTMDYRVLTTIQSDRPSYARGTAKTQGLSLNWPALRSATDNIYLSAIYDRKHFVNEIYNPEPKDQEDPITSISDKRLQVGYLGINGDHADSLGAGGVNQWSLGWVIGQLDMPRDPADTKKNDDPLQTAGSYQKFSFSLSRLQRLTPSSSLSVNLQAQHANKNLDSAEDFTLGGAQGVRAYPTSEASGDHGGLLTLEWRQILSPQWQAVMFYDHGVVKTNHSAYDKQTVPQHVALKGWGLSLGYTLPGRASARLTWARRLGSNPLANSQTGMDTDGSLVRDRLWLSLNLFI